MHQKLQTTSSLSKAHQPHLSPSISIMKLSLSAGAIALFLSSVADASSQYRNPSGSDRSNARRRRTRSAIHRDDYSDADYHRSLSSATWEGGSGHSSSPSLNYEWGIDESSSSFYDIEDVERRRKKRKRKRDSLEETERILQALEKSSREEELEQSKRSKRKKSRTRKTDDLPSPMSPKKSTKKRRRNRETDRKIVSETADPNNQSITNRTQEKPVAKKDFAPKPVTETRKLSQSVSQTKSHPDRTTWEVPSYSHKISTMMDKKKKESALESRASPATGLSRSTTSIQAGVAPTARNTPATTTRRTTATTATAQSSTLGSSTTPWVRKFLAARPKGTHFNFNGVPILLRERNSSE